MTTTKPRLRGATPAPPADVRRSLTEALSALEGVVARLRVAIEAIPATPAPSPGYVPGGATVAAVPRPGYSTTGHPESRIGAPASGRKGPTVAAMEAQGLTKRYNGHAVVDRLSFRVPLGSITGFVGPNGAGKTTTIRMLLHLAEPDAGTASVLGKDIRRPREYLPNVGALIEAPAFEPELSGEKNLRVLARLGLHDQSRIRPILGLVGLGDAGRKPYKAYSLGMKQRLGIAAAILPNPRLLVLDEPTNGLDPAGIREIRDLLRRLAAAGKTIFVSSHLLDEVQRVCDHLVVIRQGRLVYEGRVDALLARSNGRGLEETVLELTGAGRK